MNTPTAEDILKSKDCNISDDGELYDGLLTNNVINDMIEFAKLHCEAQQKSILEQSFEVRSDATGEILDLVTKNSILSAYPLENIK